MGEELEIELETALVAWLEACLVKASATRSLGTWSVVEWVCELLASW